MTRRPFGRVRKLPSGKWQARYPTGDGELRTAPMTFSTKGDASSYLATIEADLLRGQYVDPRAGKVLFSTWAEQWLQRAGKRRNTVVRDRQAIAHFLPQLGPRPLGAITPMLVQGAVDERARNAAPATVARDYSALRAVFNAAVDADLIGRTPCRKIALPRVRPPARVSLTPDDLERLFWSVPDRYRALILVGGVLGLRWGEAVGLRMSDVDFLRRTVSVSQVVEETAGEVRIVAEAKSASGIRTVSAPAFLIEELTEHVRRFRSDVATDSEALIFVGPRGGVLRRRFAERTFAPAVKQAKLDPSLTFHGLRHAAITTMVELGVHPRVMQGRAGHATARMTMELYAHVPEEADRRTAEALDLHYRRSQNRAEPVRRRRSR